MSNIVIILNGQELPLPDVPFKMITDENATDNITLDGTMYTDYINMRRSWTMEWARLSATQYQVIRDIYESQFSTGAYPILVIDYYDIAVPVKVSINDKDIRNDGDCIYGVEITLNEQYAVS